MAATVNNKDGWPGGYDGPFRKPLPLSAEKMQERRFKLVENQIKEQERKLKELEKKMQDQARAFFKLTSSAPLKLTRTMTPAIGLKSALRNLKIS